MKLENEGAAAIRYILVVRTAKYANMPCWLRCVPLLPNMPRASTPTGQLYIEARIVVRGFPYYTTLTKT